MKQSSGIRIKGVRHKLMIKQLQEYKMKLIVNYATTYQHVLYSDNTDTVIQNVLIILFEKITRYFIRFVRNGSSSISLAPFTIYKIVVARIIDNLRQGLLPSNHFILHNADIKEPSVVMADKINRIAEGLKKLFNELLFVDKYLSIYSSLCNKILMNIQLPVAEFKVFRHGVDNSPP